MFQTCRLRNLFEVKWQTKRTLTIFNHSLQWITFRLYFDINRVHDTIDYTVYFSFGNVPYLKTKRNAGWSAECDIILILWDSGHAFKTIQQYYFLSTFQQIPQQCVCYLSSNQVIRPSLLDQLTQHFHTFICTKH